MCNWLEIVKESLGLSCCIVTQFALLRLCQRAHFNWRWGRSRFNDGKEETKVLSDKIKFDECRDFPSRKLTTTFLNPTIRFYFDIDIEVSSVRWCDEVVFCESKRWWERWPRVCAIVLMNYKAKREEAGNEMWIGHKSCLKVQHSLHRRHF